MAKAILTSLSGLSADLANEYVKIEKGHPLFAKYPDQFALKVDPVDGIAMEDVSGLKASLSAARQERNEAKKIVDALGDDFDVAKAREALAKMEEMKSWKPDQKVQEMIASREKQLLEKHTKELGEAKTTLSTREKELESLLIEAEAVRAITEAKGNVTLLLPHVRTLCKVARGKDGKPYAQVVNPDGSARITLKQGSTDEMGISELVTSLKENDVFAPAFAGVGASGTGPVVKNNDRNKGPAFQPTAQDGGGTPPSYGQSAIDRLKEARRGNPTATSTPVNGSAAAGKR